MKTLWSGKGAFWICMAFSAAPALTQEQIGNSSPNSYQTFLFLSTRQRLSNTLDAQYDIFHIQQEIYRTPAATFLNAFLQYKLARNYRLLGGMTWARRHVANDENLLITEYRPWLGLQKMISTTRHFVSLRTRNEYRYFDFLPGQTYGSTVRSRADYIYKYCFTSIFNDPGYWAVVQQTESFLHVYSESPNGPALHQIAATLAVEHQLPRKWIVQCGYMFFIQPGWHQVRYVHNLRILLIKQLDWASD